MVFKPLGFFNNPVAVLKYLFSDKYGDKEQG